MTRRIHAIVRGRVQGVGFRYSAQREALRLELEGYARNLPDGSVEIEAEGTDAAIATFTEWLNDGPPGADVASVRADAVDLAGGPGFEIRR